MNQSFEDRVHRLQEGRCPVHGLWLLQVASWTCPEGRHWEADHAGCPCRPGAALYTLAGCPRGDCGVVARVWNLASPPGPWELETRWSRLPEGYPDGGGPVALDETEIREEDA